MFKKILLCSILITISLSYCESVNNSNNDNNIVISNENDEINNSNKSNMNGNETLSSNKLSEENINNTQESSNNSYRKDEHNMLNNNFNRKLFEDANNLDELKKNQDKRLINASSIKTKFKNDVWIVDKDSKTISFTIVFKNEGKRSFANKPGIVGLVLSNILEGTKTKSGEQIKELIENKSINIAITEDSDNVLVSVSCLSKYFHDVIDLLCDLMSNATFPNDKLQIKKNAIILDLKQSKFDPIALAKEKLDSIILEEPYRINIDKTIQKIQNYTDSDIKECYKQLFDPKDAMITIVGKIHNDKFVNNELTNKLIINDLNRLHDAIKEHSNKFATFIPSEQRTDLSSYDITHTHVKLDNPQSTVLFALPGVSRTNSDKIAIRAANHIFGRGGLGSRLFKTVRDQNGLVYHIVTSLNDMDLQSIVKGLALTKPENVNKVINEVKKQVKILYDNGISEEELRDFKVNKCASYIFSTNESLLNFVVSMREDGVKLEQINDYLNKYLNLTRNDINNALKKVFDPAKLVFVSCGQQINSNHDTDNKEVSQNNKNKTEVVQDNPSNDNKQEQENKTKYDINNQINIQEKVLENGMRVIVAPLGVKNSVCFGVGYFVGSADDSRDVMGISHFIEHMMFKQTKNMKSGEIKYYLNKYNKFTNAFTAYDITFYMHQCNKSFLELDMQIEADRMVNIQFDPKEIELEKGAIIEERKMRVESDPSMRYIYEAMLKSIYLYSPYAYPGIGYMDQIISCNAENMKEHYDKYYMPNNAFALFVGDIDIDEAVSLCNKYFGNISRGPEIVRNRILDPENTGITNKITHKSDQLTTTQINIFYKIPHSKIQTVKQYLTNSIVRRILADGMSSILYKKLVEKDKILHTISSDMDVSPYDFSLLSINAVLQDGQNIYNVEKEINKLIKEFTNNTLTKELFETEKQKYIDSFDLLLDNPIKLNEHIIFSLCYGYSIEEIKNVKNILNTIAFEDVQNTAKDLFDEDKRVLVIYQMPESKNEKKEVKQQESIKKQSIQQNKTSNVTKPEQKSKQNGKKQEKQR